MKPEKIMNLFFYRKYPFAVKTKAGFYIPVKTRAVTFADIEKHLAGGHVIGAYNSIPDETPDGGTCLWACIDFDNHRYSGVAQKIANEKYCVVGQIPVTTLYEPSEMKGVHVWFFFGQPVSTRMAYEFVMEIIRNNKLAVGRKAEIDIFPKSPELTGKKISWMVRLPKPEILERL